MAENTNTERGYPELPQGWPARFRCDSCDGNGEVGDPISMGDFQPPERERCPDCDGKGWCSEEVAFSADHMRSYVDADRKARAIPPMPTAVEELLRQIAQASDDGDSDTHLSKHFYNRIMSHVQTTAARPVTPLQCPKCSALWLHWPAEQTGFGKDTLNCRSEKHCDYCEKAGVEQLQRLERVTATLQAPSASLSLPAAGQEPAALNPRHLRTFLQALQAGEMSVSRSIEILDAWVGGFYEDSMVPPPPADSCLIADDEFPMEIVRKLRAKLSAAPQPSPSPAPADPELLKFYGVTTAAELIAAQARHVEKLQAKLPQTPSFAPQRVREG